ncbi:Exopolysaccharide biosynthesis transcriptional activator EpsA [Streptococcus infantarius subsp. infantarius]|nr:Exopolysaccharide biosynthesis transcriptional activator EpsA [Streptococcus infantarius subsp. infantarius]
MEKISVIVPVYNVESYLERCINSLLNQTYSNLEIILIDDGSTDRSGQICDQYKNRDEFVVIHKENAGLGMARNTGLDVATGKYIIFVDSDDYIDNNMIQSLYEEIQKTSSDTCIGGFKRVYANHSDVFKTELPKKEYIGQEVCTELLPIMFGRVEGLPSVEMSVWKVMFSNDIIQKNQLRFPSEREFISEDIIFDTEYYPLSQKVCISPTVGYNYCDNEDSLTTRYNKERFNKQVILYNELEKRVTELGIRDLAIERMYSTLIAIARYSIKLEVKFSGQNGREESYANIQNICNNETLQTVLAEQNRSTVRLQSRIINYLIKYKMINLLVYVMMIKNRLGI